MDTKLDSTSPVVADSVRDFYDKYPYPQPIDNLDQYRRLWQDPQRRRADYHLFWPARPYREDQSILVAGCGTSQAAKHALRWPAAQVTGIDFSATSVRANWGRASIKSSAPACSLILATMILTAGELGKRAPESVTERNDRNL